MLCAFYLPVVLEPVYDILCNAYFSYVLCAFYLPVVLEPVCDAVMLNRYSAHHGYGWGFYMYK